MGIVFGYGDETAIAKSVYNLSQKLGIEMPISHEVYHILYDNVSPKEACLRLMTRDLKQELDEQ